MKPPRILIAGIGNIFFGDDAFGVEVVRRFEGRAVPEGVRVVDFGIRGIDLAYALTDGCDVAILVDAVQRGGEPGRLYLIEPDLDPSDLPPPGMEPHSLDPWRVLGLARSLGGKMGRVLLVGCEPASFEAENGSMELSEPVQSAVGEAVAMIESLVAKIRAIECFESEAISL
jgi:hydrogenase maturation protease